MAVTNFFWDGDNLLQEYDVAGSTVVHYTTEPNRYGSITGQRRDSTTHCYHHDALGSATELTNSSQLVTDSRRYSAFGQLTVSSGSTVCPFQFVGGLGYYNDSGLSSVYVRRRHYSLAISRWLSTDPVGLRRERTDLYRYVSMNPINSVDPSGLILIPAVCITCCLGSGLCTYFCLDTCWDIASKGQGDFATCMWDCWDAMPIYAKIVCGAAGIVCFACLIRALAKSLAALKDTCPCYCGPAPGEFWGVLPRFACLQMPGCFCLFG